MTKCRDLKRNTQDPKMGLMENGVRRRKQLPDHKRRWIRLNTYVVEMCVWAVCDTP
jgi:hypothetical protein